MSDKQTNTTSTAAVSTLSKSPQQTSGGLTSFDEECAGMVDGVYERKKKDNSALYRHAAYGAAGVLAVVGGTAGIASAATGGCNPS